MQGAYTSDHTSFLMNSWQRVMVRGRRVPQISTNGPVLSSTSSLMEPSGAKGHCHLAICSGHPDTSAR